MGPGVVWCLDCLRVVPMKKETLIHTIPTYCPWCKPLTRLRYSFNPPAATYEPTDDDKLMLRCAGMAWTE